MYHVIFSTFFVSISNLKYCYDGVFDVTCWCHVNISRILNFGWWSHYSTNFWGRIIKFGSYDIAAISSNSDILVNHVGGCISSELFQQGCPDQAKNKICSRKHMKLWVRWSVHVDITWAPDAWQRYRRINRGEKDEIEWETLQEIRWDILLDMTGELLLLMAFLKRIDVVMLSPCTCWGGFGGVSNLDGWTEPF